MPVTLSELTSRLISDLPPVGGIPDVDQAERAVKAAIDTLGASAAIPRVTLITVTAGTATYALPADFLRLRQLAGLTRQGNVIIGGTGIIPMNAAQPIEERLTVAGLTLTIYPTPAYTLARELHYDAGHVADAEGVYPTLTDTMGRVVDGLARAEVLKLQAGWAARKAWQYQVGDERVSKEKLAAALREQADKLEGDAMQRLAMLASGGAEGRVAVYGARSRYSA